MMHINCIKQSKSVQINCKINETDSYSSHSIPSQSYHFSDTLHWMAQMLMMLGSIVLFSALLHVIIIAVQCGKTLVKHIRQVMMLIGLVLCCRTSKNKAGIIILGLLILLPQGIGGCNDIAHVAANEKACYEHINATQCHINSVSIVTVKANGSMSCLEIQHADNKPLATLKITAESLVSYCQKRTVFHSRDFRLTHEYVKRCDSAGSCSIKLCGKIGPDEDISEISKEAKLRPGFTSCDPGCGGWHCSCFYYDPSCLFYRYYALPTSNDIYEVFQCPTWIPKLRISVELGPLKLSTELSPGTKFTLPNSNISITAIGLTTPPLQAHGATYISAYGLGSSTPHWTSFTFTPPSSPGAPAKGFTGELQCATRKDAEDFNCQFDRTLCKCEGFATEVNCQCRNQLMSDHKKKNKLPSKGINHQILTINNQVATLSIQDTVVSLHIEIRNATLSRMTHVQACNAKQTGDIEGCHSCFEGGHAPILCTSKKPARALVHCGIIESSINCGPFGVNNALLIAMDVKEVVLNCSIDCGQRTFLAITGTLETRNSFEVNTTYYSSPFEKLISSSISFGSFVVDIARVVFNQFTTLIIIICVIVGCFLLVLLLRRVLSRYLANRNRQARIMARAKYY